MATKVLPKEFEIARGIRPKVLLLGNGVPRAFGGENWNRFLDGIKDKDRFPKEAKYYEFPQTMKAAMLSAGKLDSKIKDLTVNDFSLFSKTSDEEREAIQRFISVGFDFILTTNYSYEIETSILDKEELSQNQIHDLMAVTGVNNAQTQYLINTFNLVHDNQVWHIHGEARKSKSMILGQYYYGNLIAYYKNYLDNSDNRKRLGNDGKITVKSWLDAFLYGDVYIVGFGLDIAESDIWWLLEKRMLTNGHGNIFFYEPLSGTADGCQLWQSCKQYDMNECPHKSLMSCKQNAGIVDQNSCKEILLDIYDVQVKNLKFVAHTTSDYRSFYSLVLDDIKSQLTLYSDRRVVDDLIH